MKRSLLAAVLLGACTFGCRKTRLTPMTDKLLDDPHTQLIVAAIYPWDDEKMMPPEHRLSPRVQGYPILKSRAIADPAERQRIVRELRKGIGGPFPVDCVFEPHHALMLRAATASSDIVICFKCGEVEWSERWGKHETHPPSRQIGNRLLPLLSAELARP